MQYSKHVRLLKQNSFPFFWFFGYVCVPDAHHISKRPIHMLHVLIQFHKILRQFGCFVVQDRVLVRLDNFQFLPRQGSDFPVLSRVHVVVNDVVQQRRRSFGRRGISTLRTAQQSIQRPQGIQNNFRVVDLFLHCTNHRTNGPMLDQQLLVDTNDAQCSKTTRGPFQDGRRSRIRQ